ncbi:hypothetical protein ODZ16_20515 [Escherichia coli]|nr:hypothetical protein [Escherichia coli]MCV5916171.1 hypothetical protein [Escherichia coli]MCV9122127.1 hypothetical protein [Escherichia coli]MDH4438454.1 hypothetical protein [Escherichia coli]MDN2587966.1 hypothetical protein [Escherichia coli]MDW6237410.1 hypothetical protein [Escherichia coli]
MDHYCTVRDNSEELRRHAYYNIGCNVCHLICSGRSNAGQDATCPALH